MAVFTYSRVPAFNPNTSPASVAKSATGNVYDIGDTGFTTPLNLTLVATNTVTTTLVSDANGMFPDFTLVDRTQCVFKSGIAKMVLTTTTPIPGPPGAASTVPGPPGPQTTDASVLVAGTLADARLPQRLQTTNLESTYGPNAAGMKAAFVPKWKPTTAYLAGDKVLSPAGDVVSAKANFTSGVSYSATNWDISTTYAPRQFSGEFSGAADGVNIIDTSASVKATLRYEDAAAHESSVMIIKHWGAGALGTAGGQAYGINVANHPGAKNAITIHQYSRAAPAFQIDNTDIGSAIYIKNTDNQAQNPGNYGTGAFLQFKPNSDTDALFLTDALVWNNLTTKDMRIVGQYASQYALNVETPASVNTRVMYVSKQGTGAGSALDVLNKGTGTGINLVQQGAGTGVNITMTDAVVAKYGIFLNAKQYGVYFKTDTDGGTTLDIDKTSTGNGTAAKIRNLGTGDTLSFVNASGQVARFSAGGEYENLALGGGILVKAPNGTRYRIAVNNSGVVTATAA